MRLIVHDLPPENFASIGIQTAADTVISDDGTIKNCIGCFGCWVKTPGVCVLKDAYQNMGAKLATCDGLLVISRCCYGSYSPFVRNVWDRSIPYLLPHFVTKNNETHHKQRYKKQLAYSVCFYGDGITANEKETATQLVHANAKNFYLEVNNISFCNDILQIQGGAQ